MARPQEQAAVFPVAVFPAVSTASLAVQRLRSRLADQVGSADQAGSPLRTLGRSLSMSFCHAFYACTYIVDYRQMFGGRGGGFSMDVDDDMGGFGGFPFGAMPGGMGNMGGTPGGMGGMPRGRGFRSASGSSGTPRHHSPSKKENNEIVRQLKVSLNELCSGTTKRLKVGRRLLDGTTEDKVLEIQILPGWKSGTKVRFPKAGNELPGGDAQDLVFVVEEKPHEVFQREGNDLTATLQISLVEALAGAPGNKRVTRVLELLDGRRVQVPSPLGIVKPGMETRVPGEGMPIRKEGGVKSRGDLVVKWDVGFPETLSPAQKEGIRKVLSGS